MFKKTFFSSLDKVRTCAKEMQPLGRCGEAAEMAHLAAFLVSDENSFMTGSDILSDGGIRFVSATEFLIKTWTNPF